MATRTQTKAGHKLTGTENKRRNDFGFLPVARDEKNKWKNMKNRENKHVLKKQPQRSK